MESQEIVKISQELFGKTPLRVEKVAEAGSSRRYYRVGLADGESDLIFTFGDDLRENKAFCELAEFFSSQTSGIPEVLAHAEDYSWYVQRSVGRRSLLEVINECRRAGGDPEEKLVDIIRDCFKGLIRMQVADPAAWEPGVFNPPFSRRSVMWDLNYFKYDFLKVAGFDFDENALEDDFERFAGRLVEVPDSLSGFIYRDFQSRNIMIGGDGLSENVPGFIDFQGGRRGPLLYDAVSFLWQAKAGFSDGFRREMLRYYLEELGRCRAIDMQEAEALVGQIVVFRLLQVLGAYGLRGLVEKKAHFIESIPAALNNLKEQLDGGMLSDYPEMERVCREMCSDKRWQNEEKPGGLTLEVFSFSYKKGYPADYSGNGGGFMFDCRGMHNPGRYAEYKTLTGLDTPVIEFLEERGEVQDFVEKSASIVIPSVDTYIRRGFSNLQVGFGCTGGQHRSVYCAEHFGRMMAERYPEVRVIISPASDRAVREDK